MSKTDDVDGCPKPRLVQEAYTCHGQVYEGELYPKKLSAEETLDRSLLRSCFSVSWRSSYSSIPPQMHPGVKETLPPFLIDSSKVIRTTPPLPGSGGQGSGLGFDPSLGPNCRASCCPSRCPPNFAHGTGLLPALLGIERQCDTTPGGAHWRPPRLSPITRAARWVRAASRPPVRHRVTNRCWGNRLFPGLAEHPGGSLPTSPSPRRLQPRPLYPT